MPRKLRVRVWVDRYSSYELVGKQVHRERRRVDLARTAVGVDVVPYSHVERMHDLLMHPARRGEVPQLAVDELGAHALGQRPVVLSGAVLFWQWRGVSSPGIQVPRSMAQVSPSLFYLPSGCLATDIDRLCSVGRPLSRQVFRHIRYVRPRCRRLGPYRLPNRHWQLHRGHVL